MFDSIFIIRNAPTNDLVFYGQLSDTPVEELETVLGQIIMKAQGQTPGTRKLIALKQGKFFYGIHENFYFITALSKGTDKDVAERLVRKLIDSFHQNFGNALANYSGDNTPFSGFSNDIQTIILDATAKKPTSLPSTIPITDISASNSPERPNLESDASSVTISNTGDNEITEDEKTEMDEVFGDSDSDDSGFGEDNAVTSTDTSKPQDTSVFGKLSSSKIEELPAAQRKAVIQLEKPKEVSDSFNLNKPLIAPMKREAYPDGIPDYARDEVLFNESFEVQKNFESELVNYSVSDIKINLNIALTHMYEIKIDFTDYPEQPKIILPDSLKTQLGQPIEEISYFLKNWDPKIPAHITELVYELEKILTRFKAEGKLTSTQDLPGYILPDLEPLKDDIKWDPNYKAKIVPVPPPVVDESPPAQPTTPQPIAPTPVAGPVVKPVPLQNTPPQVVQKLDPKALKQKQKEEENRRKEEEKRKKKEEEEEKKRQKKEEEEKKRMKKQLETLKKAEAKEQRFQQKMENQTENDEE
jgi:hypothetical protein